MEIRTMATSNNGRGRRFERDDRDERWSSRESEWDRSVSDRDRDDYRTRSSYDRDDRNDERMSARFGYVRNEHMGIGSSSYPRYGSGGTGRAREGGVYGRGSYGQRAYDEDIYGQGSSYGQSSYGQSSYGQGAYGQGAYGQGVYGQGSYGQGGYGQGGYGQTMYEHTIGGHRGKGPRNFTRSDERVHEAVCERLADDDRIDASEIDVEVHEGEVMLSGIVEDRRTKRLAEDIIDDVPGVSDVHNHLRVRRGMFGRKESSPVEQLNSFLRGELSALETYRMALDKLDRGSQARGELESCMRSHEERISMLRNEITRRGGTPATSSGPWGVFAKTVEGGARILGDKAAIAVLEQGEDHGLSDYRNDIDRLDPDLQNIVRSRLLPAQEQTHSRMSTLKHRFS
jgi:osmotically-inducible protein OsmY